MYRILTSIRVFRPSTLVRLSSTTPIPIQNQPAIGHDDEEDDVVTPKKMTATEDYIFADSKSARFKEKNKRKQKKWMKELEQHNRAQHTPLSSFMKKETETNSEPTKEQTVR